MHKNDMEYFWAKIKNPRSAHSYAFKSKLSEATETNSKKLKSLISLYNLQVELRKKLIINNYANNSTSENILNANTSTSENVVNANTSTSENIVNANTSTSENILNANTSTSEFIVEKSKNLLILRL